MRAGRLLGATLVASALLAGSAQADTFEVTRTGDPVPGDCRPNDCSLREAILAANVSPGRDFVVLPNRRRDYRLAQVGPNEDAGMTGDLDVNNNPLVIRHPGRGRATIDANGIDRVLHIQAGARTSLVKVLITGGESGSSDGGGILTDADLALRRSGVRANAGDDGGGIDLDGTADLVLAGSAVTGNRAADDDNSNGGGINSAAAGSVTRVLRSVVSGNHADGDGGGIEAGGTDLNVTRSTIAQNRSLRNGGGIHSAALGNHRIHASTISGNRALEQPGEEASGGGMYFDGPTVSVVNSTVHGNRANLRGGGIHAQDGADLALNAVTVARNKAAADDEGVVLLGGGGLFRLASAGFSVRNSLIGLNTVGAGAGIRNDCQSDGTPFDSAGHNLITTEPAGSTCDGFDRPSDRVRANPRIGRLKANGGATKTVALKRGSAAIGLAHRPSAPNRDQRGVKRGQDPDAGAFERR